MEILVSKNAFTGHHRRGHLFDVLAFDFAILGYLLHHSFSLFIDISVKALYLLHPWSISSFSNSFTEGFYWQERYWIRGSKRSRRNQPLDNFMHVIASKFTVMESLCYRWPRIYSDSVTLMLLPFPKTTFIIIVILGFVIHERHDGCHMLNRIC